MDVTEICEQLIQHTRSTEETQTPRTATSGSPAPQAHPHESITETEFKKLWVIFHEHRKRGENDTHRCLCGPQRQVTSTPACVYSASMRPPLLVRRSAGGQADGSIETSAGFVSHSVLKKEKVCFSDENNQVRKGISV